MSEEANKEAVRRLFNIINSRDLSRLGEVCTDDVTYRSSSGDDGVQGIDGYREELTGLFEAFPDMEMSPEEIGADGDKVYCVYRWTGTHEGEYMGITPQKHRVDLLISSNCRCRDGKVAEVVDFMDALMLLWQLGALGDEVYPGGRDWPTGETKLRAR